METIKTFEELLQYPQLRHIMNEISIPRNTVYITGELLASSQEYQKILFNKINLSMTLIMYWLFDDSYIQSHMKGLWLSEHTKDAQQLIMIANILYQQPCIKDELLTRPSWIVLLPGVLTVDDTDFEIYKVSFDKLKHRMLELFELD